MDQRTLSGWYLTLIPIKLFLFSIAGRQIIYRPSTYLITKLRKLSNSRKLAGASRNVKANLIV